MTAIKKKEVAVMSKRSDYQQLSVLEDIPVDVIYKIRTRISDKILFSHNHNLDQFLASQQVIRAVEDYEMLISKVLNS